MIKATRFFIEDTPLCLMSYKINKLFLSAVKHNNTFSVTYFNGVMFRSFLSSSGYLKVTNKLFLIMQFLTFDIYFNINFSIMESHTA